MKHKSVRNDLSFVAFEAAVMDFGCPEFKHPL